MVQIDGGMEFKQTEGAPQPWTIIMMGWSVTIITFVAFLVAAS
jgi:hypothetical protein